MDFNAKLFFKINDLQGRNRWLDLFGKAGAEWVIVAMLGWYYVSIFIDVNQDKNSILLKIFSFPIAWVAGWVISIFVGSIVREPRPHITYPESRLMFTPMMSWKSFPSDHAMAAWLIFFLAFIYSLPGIEALALMALWVCWGRVYAGLHYPFDIVGGMSLAALVAAIAYNLILMFF